LADAGTVGHEESHLRRGGIQHETGLWARQPRAKQVVLYLLTCGHGVGRIRWFFIRWLISVNCWCWSTNTVDESL
jgi:hypothetical protein